MAETAEDLSGELLWLKSEEGTSVPSLWLQRNGGVLLCGTRKKGNTYRLVARPEDAQHFSVWYGSTGSAILMYSTADYEQARRVFRLCATIVST